MTVPSPTVPDEVPSVPSAAGPSCYHGGAFFEAIGDEFSDLARREQVINADVLDAWFPPAPAILETLHRHLEWIVRTSPPTHAEGVVRAISRSIGVPSDCILPSAGSSSLIFRALTHWLHPDSRVLILDPSYGEYSHLLRNVLRCRVEAVPLDRANGYELTRELLETHLARGTDLFLWVNPNSPTGRHMPRVDAEAVLAGVPDRTRVWIDETYIDYVDPGESLARFAAGSGNVVVCKSLSKVFALSGLRAGYLCGPAALLADLNRLTPPWAMGLPAQIATVFALQSGAYYRERYRETRDLRARLVNGLHELGLTDTVPSVTNFVMCHLPPEFGTVSNLVEGCRERGLFVRDLDPDRTGRHTDAFRIAVKDAATTERMLAILGQVLDRNA